MKKSTRFVNLRTQNLVEAFGPINSGTGFVTIATVTPGGYGPKRRVKADSFHSDCLDQDGRPYATGYVPVGTPSGSGSRATKVTEANDMDLIDHLDKLSDDELAEMIQRQQRIAKDAEDIIDKAKAVAKSRVKTEGTKIYGDIAMVFSSGKKFDASTARKNLTPEQYSRICMLKPDAALAKKALGEGSDVYKLCQKDNGWTLSVREATEKDRDNAAIAEAASDIEIFDLPQF